MPVCDGCGAQVDDLHIRRRIERLELATRFRPIHISVLLIDAAPPPRFEDFFYRASHPSERSPAARAYFEALLRCTGFAPEAQSPLSEEAALAEFQRHGFFLIGAIECPLETHPDPAHAIERAAPTVLRRVSVSYKPKTVALLSIGTRPLVEMFKDNGWADRLVLKEGEPFADASDEALAKALGQRTAA